MADETRPVDETLVTVARIPDLLQADLIRSRLEASGVDVFIADETVRALRYPGFVMQPAKIQVRESQLDAARETLAGMAAAEDEDAPGAERGLDVRLPGRRFKQFLQWLVVLVIMVLAVELLLWVWELF
jgi:hypothetical protein